MNKNKGIIGIGLILAIVLGIVVVGGGAYYLGKNGYKKEVNNLPVIDNKQSNIPYIKLLSPNGGEEYSTSTTIEQIPVTWESSGIVSKNVAFYIKNMSTGSEELRGIYPDSGSTNIYGIPSGNYKMRICSTNQKNGNLEVTYDPDCATASDYSDNSFTINSVPTKNISTALPLKYLDSQNWPPVITTSSQSYSCIPHKNIGDATDDVVQKTINGKKYCITSFIDAGAGSRFGEYTYTTPSISGSGTRTMSFNLRWSSCGAYDKPESDQCQATVSTFLNNLDVMVDSLMQS